MSFAWGSESSGVLLGLTAWGGGIISLMILVRSPIVEPRPPPAAPGLTVIEKIAARSESEPAWIFSLPLDAESFPPSGWARNEYFKPMDEQDTMIQPRTVEAGVIEPPRPASPRFVCDRKTFMKNGHLHWYCKRH